MPQLTVKSQRRFPMPDPSQAVDRDQFFRARGPYYHPSEHRYLRSYVNPDAYELTVEDFPGRTRVTPDAPIDLDLPPKPHLTPNFPGGHGGLDDVADGTRPRSTRQVEQIDVLDIPDDVVSYRWLVVRRGGGYRFDETFPVERPVVQGVVMPSVEYRHTLRVPSTGRYDVTVRRLRDDGSVRDERSRSIDLRDFLVVSIGDSYAAGEGNPDVPGRPEHEDHWYDWGIVGAAVGVVAATGMYMAPIAYVFAKDAMDRMTDRLKQEFTSASIGKTIAMDPAPLWLEEKAHRSLRAGPAVAASALEDPETGTLVTFLSFARSGAEVFDGVTGPRTSNGVPDDDWIGNVGQLEEVERTLREAGRTTIDALVVSVGGNDLGFSSRLKDLVKNDWPVVLGNEGDNDLNRRKTRQRIEHLLESGELDARFDHLRNRLEELRIDIKQVFLTEYPEAMFDRAGGELGPGCGIFASPDIVDLNVDDLDARITRRGAQRLNTSLRRYASAFRWVHVDGIADGFRGHGYCMGEESFYRSAEGSLIIQGDTDGTMHPSGQGQAVYAERIAQALSQHMVHPRLGVTEGRPDVEAGTVVDVREHWREVRLTNDFANAPVVLASMQTANGEDPSAVRIRRLGERRFELRIEEERADDTHPNAEDVGFVAFPEGRVRDRHGRLVARTGFVSADQPGQDRWRHVDFSEELGGTEVVVLARVLSANGHQPVHVRLRDGSGDGQDSGNASFSFKLEEWPSLDGTHHEERIGWAVFRRGVHELSDALVLECGIADGIKEHWDDVGLRGSYERPPVVLTQCQSFNGSDPVVTRQRPPEGGTVDLRLQEGPSGGDHTRERVGYVALGSRAR